MRTKAGTLVNILNDTVDNLQWTITPTGVWYEDTGEQMIRLEHNLKTNVYATDRVTFEINFTPDGFKTSDTETIGEDYVQCEMTQNTTDGFFWTAQVVEGYVKCAGTELVDDVCGWSINPLYMQDNMYTQTPESSYDWVAFTDDDPTDPWCTHANTEVGATLLPYECTQLKCIIERPLDTGDDLKDL